MGRHQLPGRRRHHDPDDRMDRRALRAQALLYGVRHHVRGVVGAVRRRAIAQPDRVLPPAARGGGRRDDADLASRPDGNLPTARADDGDGGMGHRHDGRPHHGAHHRWIYHRCVELALELLHQCADRRAGHLHGLPLPRGPALHARAQEGWQHRLGRDPVPGRLAGRRRNRSRARSSAQTGFRRHGSATARCWRCQRLPC